MPIILNNIVVEINCQVLLWRSHFKIFEVYRNIQVFFISSLRGKVTVQMRVFSIDNGMITQTEKIKCPVITSHYQDMINSMFV